MKLVTRGIAIALASLGLMGGALAAPVEALLYSFTGGTDGGYPFAGLIADSEGTLYGTTGGGGRGNNGTVFRLTPARDKTTGKTTWTESVLYSFQGGSDGSDPFAGLIADSEGALYGTTQNGGA
jgi:uncharacterized repeat protein (TIGR03803 family)